jgi:hypothetical protein
MWQNMLVGANDRIETLHGCKAFLGGGFAAKWGNCSGMKEEAKIRCNSRGNLRRGILEPCFALLSASPANSIKQITQFKIKTKI